MKATLRIPLPPTLNELIDDNRKGINYANAKKQKIDFSIAKSAEDQGFPVFSGNVWVMLDFYVCRFSRDPDDIDGSQKYLFDGLANDFEWQEKFTGKWHDIARKIKKDNLMLIENHKHIQYHRSKTKEDYLELTLYTDLEEFSNDVKQRLDDELEKRNRKQSDKRLKKAA